MIYSGIIFLFYPNTNELNVHCTSTMSFLKHLKTFQPLQRNQELSASFVRWKYLQLFGTTRASGSTGLQSGQWWRCVINIHFNLIFEFSSFFLYRCLKTKDFYFKVFVKILEAVCMWSSNYKKMLFIQTVNWKKKVNKLLWSVWGLHGLTVDIS